jgi:hypothetical protein
MTYQVTKSNKHDHNFISHVKNPFCEKQTKLQLAVTIIFHVIIFPLGLYRLGQIFYSHCCKRSAIPAGKQTDPSKLRNQVVNSVRATPQQKALHTAQMAEKFAIANKHTFNNHQFVTSGPNSERICRLMNISEEVTRSFSDSIAIAPEAPLTGHEVGQADKLMKISYAISHYALEDLESFTKSLSGKSDEEAFIATKYFLDRVYRCAQCYHETLAASKAKVNDGMKETWRKLYNDICLKIQKPLNDNPVLKAMSEQQEIWTRRDLSQAEGEALIQSINFGDINA